MKTLFLKIKQFWKDHPQWSSVLIAAFSFTLLQVASGVISNSAYDWFQIEFIPWSTKIITINNFILLVAIFCVFFVGIVGWLAGRSTNPQIFQSSLLEYNNYLRLLRGIHSISYLKLLIEINRYIQVNFEHRSDTSTLEKLIDKFFLAINDCLGAAQHPNGFLS